MRVWRYVYRAYVCGGRSLRSLFNQCSYRQHTKAFIVAHPKL